MKQSGKAKVQLKNVLRWLILILCGSMLGVNVYLANARSLVGNQLPMPFGYGAAVVLSGSMEPEFSEGDLIVVKEAEHYSERDIVVFQSGNTLVVHRIVRIDGQTVTTQGDANETEDAPIDVSAIKGKVLFSIPFAGHIVGFLKTPVGTICMIAAAIALVEIPCRTEKKKDEAQRQKILEEIERLKKEMES